MADKKDVFLFVATYDSVDDAKTDYEAVKALHSEGTIDTYDAAIVEKDTEGKVHFHRHGGRQTKRGTWTGAAAGAVVGILFPPSIIAGAIVGGAAGGVIGHFWHGMSRKDVKDLGELLDAGSAGLIVVGRAKLSDKLEPATTHAQKKTEKKVSVDAKEFEKEMAAATPVPAAAGGQAKGT